MPIITDIYIQSSHRNECHLDDVSCIVVCVSAGKLEGYVACVHIRKSCGWFGIVWQYLRLLLTPVVMLGIYNVLD